MPAYERLLGAHVNRPCKLLADFIFIECHATNLNPFGLTIQLDRFVRTAVELRNYIIFPR